MSTITVISTARRRVGAARRRVRRWGKDCHAAVALEFVLIIPMLVGLLAFGNEAVGVRLQQKVLQDFSAVTADVIAGYYNNAANTGAGTTSAGTYSVPKTSTYSRSTGVTSDEVASTRTMLSLKALTGGMRVLLAEIHPVSDEKKISDNPCVREASVVLDSAKPFTCQILALAPTNQTKEPTLSGTVCDTIPAVWDAGKLGCSGTDTKITSPTPCTGSGDGDGYRITWKFGFDTGTDGTAKRVCECASSLEVQGLTVYDKSLIAVLKNGRYTLGSHGDIITKNDVGSVRAGVLVWAASYRKGLFTGILNKETIDRLTLQSWNWASKLDDPTLATYSAGGVALVDENGENMISCYGKDS